MKNGLPGTQKRWTEGCWMPLVVAVLMIAPAGSGATPPEKPTSINLEGAPLKVCSTEPLTGYFRDGRCTTGKQDRGSHTVCATMTQEFLEYSKSRGNDLMSPSPRYRFPGLKPGDQWCLCAARWLEAYRAQVAPPVHLEESHKAALRIVSREALEKHATPKPTRRVK